MQTNLNVIGFLQRKNFFHQQSSLSPTSRFSSKYASNKTPEKTAFSKTGSSFQGQLQKINENRFSAKPIKTHQSSKNNLGDRQTQAKLISFDSSRVEVRMCLEQLLRRVSTELRLLEGTMNQFASHLQDLFNKKLLSLKHQMLQAVETIFAQAKDNFKAQLNYNEDIRLKKSAETKAKLIESEARLKQMKVSMEGNWKKVAGQVLGEQLDQSLQAILQESGKLRMEMNGSNKKDLDSNGSDGWSLMKKGIGILIKSQLLNEPDQNIL